MGFDELDFQFKWYASITEIFASDQKFWKLYISRALNNLAKLFKPDMVPEPFHIRYQR